MKKLLIVLCIVAFSQTRVPFQEQRSNGTNQVVLQAPSSIGSDFNLTLPSALPATSGRCVTGSTSGVLAIDGSCDKLVSDYNWTQTLGARSGSGAITLTFTGSSCPAAGSDAQYVYRLHESLIPTNYELAISNGAGTCVRGGAGTIVATGPTATYTTAIATSASAGWQEAIFSVPDSNSVYIRAGIGSYHVYSDILTEDRYLNVSCDGVGAILVPRVANLNIINSSGPGGPKIVGCAMTNVHGVAGVTGILTDNPDGNSVGTYLVGNNITGMAYGVHLGTVYAVRAFHDNTISDSSVAALWLDNVETGDAGIGLIGPNNLFSDSVGAAYGVLWNGPGNFKLKNNSFNGFVEQVHAEPTMGIVNVSGTAVTWVSGRRFRTTWPSGSGFAAGSTVASTVSSVTGSTALVLATSQPTCTGCPYYVGTSGQMQITGNTFDGGTVTTHSVRVVGPIPFFNFQIDGNFATAYSVAAFKGITLEASGFYHGSIKHNNIPTSTTGTTIGIDITGGNFVEVSDNQFVNNLTGVKIGASAVSVTTDGNKCVNSSTTNCVLSAAASTIVREIVPVTFAQLSALTVANSSRLYCSDCTATAGVCAGSGTGANATRINSAWMCEAGGNANAFVQNGNSFGAAAFLGTNDNFPLAIKTNNTQIWTFNTTGHLYAAINNSYDIGAGIAANSPRSIYAATSVVAPLYGSITSASIGFQTDSATRWNVTAAGMFVPNVNLTYDIGDEATPKLVRSIFAQSGKFLSTGGTASSDYVSSRKYNICDQTGGVCGWDWQAVVVSTAKSTFWRDPAGDPALTIVRQESSTLANYSNIYTDWLPAIRETALGHTLTDARYPRLGSNGRRWDAIYSDDGIFTDDVTVGDALSVTGPTLLNGATNTMPGTLSPGITGLGKIGTASLQYGEVNAVLGNYSGLLTASAGLTVAGTVTFPTGTTGHCWINSGSGVGGWSACTGASTFSDSVFRVQDNGDATKQLAFEVSGFTSGATRTVTIPNASMVMAGTNVSGQSFTAAQNITNAVAGHGELLTVYNSLGDGTYRPGCVVLGSTDTVATIYGTARICSGFESAVFTNEKFEIQTITGSGTYQNALTIKNQDVTVPGTLTATGLATFNGNVDMLASGINYMYGTLAAQTNNSGSIGTSGVRYATYFGVLGNFSSTLTAVALTVNTATPAVVGQCWIATSTGDAGSWQSCAGGGSNWTTTGADIYRSSYVGIGTTAPAAHLHVSGEFAALFLDGYSATSPNILQRHARGTEASPTASQSGDRIGQIAVQGYGTSRVTSGRIKFMAGSLHSGTNAETYISLATTASASTTATDRWRVSSAGHWLAEADNTYDIGASGATRPRNYFGAGTGTFGGVLTANANLVLNASVASDVIASIDDTFILGSASFRWASVALYDLNIGSGGTVSGSPTPTASNTWDLGSASALWANIHGTTIIAGSNFLPDVDGGADVGSTTKYMEKVWTNRLDVKTQIIAPSGSAGYTGTVTVRDAAGTGTCTNIFSAGLRTGGTC